MQEIERPVKDIDLVVRSSDRGRLREMLEARGYEIDRDLLVAMEGRPLKPGNDISAEDFDLAIDPRKMVGNPRRNVER